MKLPSWLSAQHISFLGCLLMLFSITLSPAGMSIGTVLLLLGAIWASWEARPKLKLQHPWLFWGFFAYFCWVLLSFFWTENTDLFLEDVRIKLPFLLIPIAFSLIPAFTFKQQKAMMLTYCFSQLIIAFYSVAGYWQNFEHSIDRVKKNGALEIFGGANHIYFGVSLALAILIAVHILFKYKSYFPKLSKIWPILYILIATLCLHSMTSRTGLLAFYGGISMYFLLFIILKRKWKLGLVIVASLILLPVLSYKLIPSFTYRVNVTIWDYEYSQEENADLNYQSVGLRIKAWGCSWGIFKDTPVFGVGFGDLGDELFACYEEIELKAERVRWLKKLS